VAGAGSRMNAYTEALKAEIRQRASEPRIRADGLPDMSVKTIYLGGGTPSQLNMDQLSAILEQAESSFILADTLECTLECNPDDVTPPYAKDIASTAINRVSMGVQSFDDDMLRFLKRRHTAAGAVNAVHHLHVAGLRNISIDLMYGLPGQSLESFRHDIERALDLEVTHISAYCLSYEEGTPMYWQLKSGKIKAVDDELCSDMYYMLTDMLTGHGYEHYEISNFARPGMYSRHNSSYWNGTPYIGIGAGAHSYSAARRSWNISDIDRYIEGITKGIPDREWEDLSRDELREERIMLSLRTSQGLDMQAFSCDFGPLAAISCKEKAARFVEGGFMEFTGDCLRLTRKGIFTSDNIISSLF